jgi:leucyl/phenylalanyl-tRNA---protein transferase
MTDRRPSFNENVASAQPRFAETAAARLRRRSLGIAYALRPNRIGLMPRVAWMTARHLLGPAEARRLPERPIYYGRQGLVGICNDLGVEHLIAAYGKGYFPMCHIGPMKWWSPAERAVLDPNEAHVPKNVRRFLRQGRFRVTFDQDFARVMQACAQPREGKAPLTWITPRIMNAFWALHLAGYAHSVEVRDAAGHLVGGLYGLAIGDVFFGESQFSTVEHASKVAVAVLHAHLARWGFALRDAKNMTPHLASLGFRTVDRATFQDLLREHAAKPSRTGRWSVDESLDLSRPQPPATTARRSLAAVP